MTKQIPLTQGKVALVDDADFQHLTQWLWHAHKGKGERWYAYRKEGPRAAQKTIAMHRQIINAPPDLEVDHRDNDGLNNQRYNLRVCTHAQNGQNRGKLSTNTTGYKGVYPYYGRYLAKIGVNRETIPLGDFTTPEEAARVYDEAARKYHGPFAKTNF